MKTPYCFTCGTENKDAITASCQHCTAFFTDHPKAPRKYFCVRCGTAIDDWLIRAAHNLKKIRTQCERCEAHI